MSNFLRKLHTISHSGCTNLQSHQQCTKGSFFFTASLTLIFFFFLIIAVLTHFRWYVIVVLVCISLVISEWCWYSFHIPVGHIYVSFRKICIQIVAHFLIGLFVFSCWVIWVHYIFWILTPYKIFTNIFCHLVDCLFILLFPLLCRSILVCYSLAWLFLPSLSLLLKSDPKYHLQDWCQGAYSPCMFSCRSFMVSGLTLKTCIHLELLLVCGVRR